MMIYMNVHSSAAPTSDASPEQASQQSIAGSAAGSFDPANVVAHAESHARTSTRSCPQHDADWLRHATAEQIDDALAEGSLQQLLGDAVA